MSPQQLLTFIEQHVELGVTTADHADIYGGYACEQAFGDALRLKPALRQSLELVSKCGIATTAKPGNPIGHYHHRPRPYRTERGTIAAPSAYRLPRSAADPPADPLMDADDVAEAFVALHKSGKVRHFGVSNFTPAQFQLLQSRLPFSLATNQVEISPIHQPAILDGTLDQCQQLRIEPMAWSCLGADACSTTSSSSRCATSCSGWRKKSAPRPSSRWCTPG